MQDQLFNEKLIKRYDVPVPRYTSYPTAPQFYSIDHSQYRRWVRLSNQDEPPNPLSLYIHIPFCSTVCYYCACTKIITKNRKHAIPYVQNLLAEMRLLGSLFNEGRQVKQIHFGGGTPTFLQQEQMLQLITAMKEFFLFCPDEDGEYSIELDPRQVDVDDIDFLRTLGFNRLSLGVQDVDQRVQAAVNRIQPLTKTREILDAAQTYGFKSTNLDLIYGLPLQTLDSFSATLDKIIDLGPDRLSIFNYAHLPQRFKVQRQIKQSDLPSAQSKLDMLRLIIEKLCDAGYVFIGMDHFARPDDSLAKAQENGGLHRNFQGYSTYGNCDLIGMGMSSIGQVGGNYVQNHRQLKAYQNAITGNELPVARGFELKTDDQLRRTIIRELMCHFYLSTRSIERKFKVEFKRYFAPELQALRYMVDDGLIQLDDAEIRVQNAGRLLVRNICSVFDRYLDAPKIQQNYSSAI